MSSVLDELDGAAVVDACRMRSATLG